jgi:hypothetical protein
MPTVSSSTGASAGGAGAALAAQARLGQEDREAGLEVVELEELPDQLGHEATLLKPQQLRGAGERGMLLVVDRLVDVRSQLRAYLAQHAIRFQRGHDQTVQFL